MASAAATSKIVQGLKQVKPILSVDRSEARRRVFNLYKAWYRQVPFVVYQFDVPFGIKEGRDKVREEFLKHKHVSDIRSIDLLVIKGQMELVETTEVWKQKHHIMKYFQEGHIEKPTGFLAKFYDGHD